MTDIEWHSKSAELLTGLLGHTDQILDLTLLSDGSLVSSSKDRTVRIWDPESFQNKSTLSLGNKNLNALASLTSGLLAISVDDKIKIYNPRTEEFEKTLTGHPKTITTLLGIPGNYLASGAQDNIIKIWNLEKGTMDRNLYGHTYFIRYIYSNILF